MLKINDQQGKSLWSLYLKAEQSSGIEEKEINARYLRNFVCLSSLSEKNENVRVGRNKVCLKSWQINYTGGTIQAEESYWGTRKGKWGSKATQISSREADGLAQEQKC